MGKLRRRRRRRKTSDKDQQPSALTGLLLYIFAQELCLLMNPFSSDPFLPTYYLMHFAMTIPSLSTESTKFVLPTTGAVSWKRPV